MIMRPFHGLFFAFLALLCGGLVLLGRFARTHGERGKKALLLGLSLFNLVFYCVYKFALSRDGQFLEVYGL